MAMQEGLVARDKRVTRKYLSIYTKFFILNLADERGSEDHVDSLSWACLFERACCVCVKFHHSAAWWELVNTVMHFCPFAIVNKETQVLGLNSAVTYEVWWGNLGDGQDLAKERD